jgi:hypothetical protein
MEVTKVPKKIVTVIEPKRSMTVNLLKSQAQIKRKVIGRKRA